MPFSQGRRDRRVSTAPPAERQTLGSDTVALTVTLTVPCRYHCHRYCHCHCHCATLSRLTAATAARRLAKAIEAPCETHPRRVSPRRRNLEESNQPAALARVTSRKHPTRIQASAHKVYRNRIIRKCHLSFSHDISIIMQCAPFLLSPAPASPPIISPHRICASVLTHERTTCIPTSPMVAFRDHPLLHLVGSHLLGYGATVRPRGGLRSHKVGVRR